MFTGIVEETGRIYKIDKGSSSAKVYIKADKVLDNTIVGDSIAVNGICLTVTSMDKGMFVADVMSETMNRTSMNILNNNSKVNLERAMSANGRFGGHIVSGHVDGTGTIENIVEDDNAIWYTIVTSKAILKYVVEKGSITIDGISLTVAYVDDNCFKVSVIPHTMLVTNLSERKKCDIVNLECDIIGKYVEKLLKFDNNQNNKVESNITEEFLIKNGFL